MPLGTPAGARLLPGCAALIIALALAVPAAAQPAPTVSVMVTGKSGQVISNPTTVAAAAVTERVGSTDCSVAAGTPLAALAAVGLPTHLVDYGQCSANPADAALLFVDGISGVANSCDMGWACKVNNRGCLAAADPNGAWGAGPMQGGDKVLWFWCVSYPCQRSLEVRVAASVRARAMLAVSVRSYDDDGHWIAASGVKVSFGTATARTGTSGAVRIPAPSRAGSYLVRASEMNSALKRSAAFPASVTVTAH
jgi:hypothetical protein